MKNSLLLLVGIGMMFTNVSAQINEEMLDMTIANWAPEMKVNQKVMADVRTALTSNDKRVQDEAINKYTVNEKRDFKQVNFLHPTNPEATQLSRIVASDTTVNVRSFKLDELIGDQRLKGQTLPFMAYAPEKNTQPYFVMGYTTQDENVVASKDDEESEPVSMLLNQKNQQPSQKSETVTLPNGITYGPGFYSLPDGTLFVKGADGNYAELKSEKKSKKELAEQQARETAIADTAKKTYSLSVTQQGDPNLLASVGNPKGMSTSSADSQTNGDDGMKTVTVNGVERLMVKDQYNKWVPADNNGDMSKVTLNGKDFLTSGGQTEAAGVRNAYKYGMRDASGYQGNYYRNANNGHPLGGGGMQTVNVVATPVGGFYGGVGVYGSVQYGHSTWPQNRGGQNSCHYTGFQY